MEQNGLSPVDSFDSDLCKLDIFTDAGRSALEQRLGLSGGGEWWLDTTKPPVELDSNGQLDEGAILDVEAQSRAWFRNPFDTNPEFRDNNYRLLSRLNELARLQGLVEGVALKNYGPTDEHHISHSTLSLHVFDNPDSDLHQQYNNYPLLDVHASIDELPSNHTNGTYSKPDANLSHRQRPSVFDSHGKPLSEIYPGYPLQKQMNGSDALPPYPTAKLPFTLQPQKSQQPPSPHQVQSMRSHKNRGYRKRTPLPGQLVPPAGMLNRTYSKEDLNQLRTEIGAVPTTRRSGGSLMGNFLTSSGPINEPDSDGDVSKSIDRELADSDVLSQSLNEAGFDRLNRSGVRTNASYASVRSTDVIGIALLQESLLRNHSGSRGQLNGSGSSLNASMTEMEGLLRPNLRNRSQNSLNVSDVDSGAPESVSQLESHGKRKAPPEPLQLHASIHNNPDDNYQGEAPTTAVEGTDEVDNAEDPKTVALDRNLRTQTSVRKNSFFDDSTKPESVNGTPVDRLSSQTTFEQMEARASQETFILRRSSDAEEGGSPKSLFAGGNEAKILLNVSYDLPQKLLPRPEVIESTDYSTDPIKPGITSVMRRPLAPSGIKPPSRIPAMGKIHRYGPPVSSSAAVIRSRPSTRQVHLKNPTTSTESSVSGNRSISDSRQRGSREPNSTKLPMPPLKTTQQTLRAPQPKASRSDASPKRTATRRPGPTAPSARGSGSRS